MEEKELQNGAFMESLVRNNKKIREDRAMAIAEDADICFKRVVEDLEMKVKRLRRDRDNMLDMSPENATSLILASDFDPQAFVDKDLSIGVELRNLEIKLEIARERYATLFGG